MIVVHSSGHITNSMLPNLLDHRMTSEPTDRRGVVVPKKCLLLGNACWPVMGQVYLDLFLFISEITTVPLESMSHHVSYLILVLFFPSSSISSKRSFVDPFLSLSWGDGVDLSGDEVTAAKLAMVAGSIIDVLVANGTGATGTNSADVL